MLFFILTLGILSISCSDNGDDDGALSEELIVKIENNMNASTWRITRFIDSGKDETNDFVGYNFKFNNSGVLTANNGTNNYEGTWSVTDSNSNDDSLDDLHFNINFDLTNDFEDLNDDWDIVSQTSNKLELIDVSGGFVDDDDLSAVVESRDWKAGDRGNLQ